VIHQASNPTTNSVSHGNATQTLTSSGNYIVRVGSYGNPNDDQFWNVDGSGNRTTFKQALYDSTFPYVDTLA
jgi:hypothetical protein